MHVYTAAFGVMGFMIVSDRLHIFCAFAMNHLSDSTLCSLYHDTINRSVYLYCLRDRNTAHLSPDAPPSVLTTTLHPLYFSHCVTSSIPVLKRFDYQQCIMRANSRCTCLCNQSCVQRLRHHRPCVRSVLCVFVGSAVRRLFRRLGTTWRRMSLINQGLEHQSTIFNVHVHPTSRDRSPYIVFCCCCCCCWWQHLAWIIYL